MSEQSLSYSNFHIDSDFENPLICFGLGNHLCDPLLWSTSSVQNLSSQDQDLRFIHLVWIPSGLFFRLHQGFLFKVQMNSHKYVLNLKLHWVTSSTYHSRSVPTGLQPTIPLSVPNIPTYHSVPTSRKSTSLTKIFSTAILDYLYTIVHLSTINRRAGFIKNSSRKTHWIMKWRFVSFKFSSPHSPSHFSLWSHHSQHLATNIAS